jgi:hypothetical protein
MPTGRLIRVQNYRRDPTAMIYVVVEANGTTAVDILKKALAHVESEYEDLGRVNDSLIDALNLKAGQFGRLT